MDSRQLYPIQHCERSAREGRPGEHTHAASEPRPWGAEVVRSAGEEVRRAGLHWQVADQIPEELKLALQPILEMLASITEQVSGYDREIARLSTQTYPETAHPGESGGSDHRSVLHAHDRGSQAHGAQPPTWRQSRRWGLGKGFPSPGGESRVRSPGRLMMPSPTFCGCSNCRPKRRARKPSSSFSHPSHRAGDTSGSRSRSVGPLGGAMEIA